MEFKGTQGGWGPSDIHSQIITTEDTNICQVFKHDTEEGKANIQLIASALELLKVALAVKRLESLIRFENPDPNNGSECDESSALNSLLKLTDKAINKALKP